MTETSDCVRVLRIGDDPEASPLSAQALGAADEHLTVTAERDFAAGLEQVRDGRVDCVVSDHRPAGFDGLSFLRAVRRERPQFPFVLVPFSDGVARAAVAANVTAYVPADDADALAAVADAVGTHATAGERESGVRMPIKDRSVREELRLKERAMDKAPVGITIADPSLPDTPLVYVNDSFEEMTGYTKEEAIGVNCRFLQGEATDERKPQRMREAVEAERPTTVELVNYQQDGTQFWNRVDVNPIRDEDGEVTHFVGFQTDVTDRKRAERQVQWERENLRLLLDRIDGLVGDVTELLVRAETTGELYRLTADRLGTGDEYAFAWVGGYDPTSETVDVVEWAGGDRSVTETTVDLDSSMSDARATARAVETGEIQVLEPLGSARPVGPESDDLGACALVPLSYRTTTYGVLAVYSQSADVFDARETAVLSALGRSIGTTLNAIRSKRIASTDTVVEVGLQVDDEDFFVAALSAALSTAFDYEGTLTGSDGSVRMLFDVDRPDGDRVLEAATALSTVERGDLLVERDDGCTVQFTLTGSALVDVLSDHGARLQRITAENGVAEVRFQVAEDRDARAVVDRLEATYAGVDLVAYHESEQPAQTARGFRATVEDRLTDRQRAALQKAYVSGFFDWPRQVDGDRLAASMDIVPSTFHQHLRVAERKLVSAFFDE